MKVGDTSTKKSKKENSGTCPVKKNDKDLDGENLCKPVEKSDVHSDAASNWKMEDVDKHSSDPRADAPSDSKMVEDVDNRTILDENELKEINECVKLCIEDMV
ncbi:hypothetical protein LWI28_002155 [Acer negundo]|uniref:Uncharacterized protein n=1 Tax=Acer negundo TaxID=4023 RepID=A0AAD5ISM2_ACENE|nr:hypothetical protein LWI28_002155 [Acer negundo]